MNRWNGWICAGLILCCVAIYGQTLLHDFVDYDDPLYVTENPEVQAGLTWSNMTWAFTTDRAVHMHPLTWMSHMLDCNLYGLRPWGHHLTSVFFHTLDTLLLFLVFSRITRRIWPSALLAALFAVHPLHVESVAWVSERKDVLCMLFWTGSIGAYSWYRQHPGPWRYLAVAFLFLLGLMSKTMAATLPFVLLLLDYWPLGQISNAASLGTVARKAGRLAVEKIPLFLLTMLFCGLTFMIQAGANNLVYGERVPFLARCANAVVVYVLYLVQTVWPAGLAVYYPHPIMRPLWQVAGAAVILAGITFFCLRNARRRPYLIVGWCWYVGTLVPVIELVQFATFSHADRYTYIPHIGIFIMVAWGLDELRQTWQIPTAVGACVPVAVIAGFGLVAAHQTTYWKNGETLFRHALAVTEDNSTSRNNLGVALADLGKYDAAKEQFGKALQLDPRYSDAIENIAMILSKEGQYDMAAAKHREALAVNPKQPKARANLRIALKQAGKLDAAEAEYNSILQKDKKSLEDYCRLGTIAMSLGGTSEALSAFTEAMKLDPNGKKTNLAMADALVDEGRPGDALGYYEKALQAEPHDAQTLYNMGVVLSSLRRPEDAAQKYREALQWKPDFARAYNNLASLSANAQRLDEAVELYRKAIALDAGYAQARVNLARVLAFQGKTEEAIGFYEEALKTDPGLLHAHVSLATLLMGNKRIDEAEAHLKKVLEIDPNNAEALKLMKNIEAGRSAPSASERKAP